MRRFISKIFIGLAIMAGFFMVNFFLNTWLAHRKSEGRNIVRTLIVGDSHILSGINPEQIDSCKHVAQVGEHYVISFHKIKYFVERYPGIRRIILGCSFHNFSGVDDDKFVSRKWGNTMLRRVYLIMRLNDFKGISVAWEKYAHTLIKYMMLYPHTHHESKFTGGFVKKEFYLDKVKPETSIGNHYIREGRVVGVSTINTSYLDSIIQFTRQNAVELILVATPVHQDYRTKIPLHVKSHFDKIRIACVQKKQKVFDFSAFPFGDQLYNDYNHLNYDGAVVFTRMLMDSILIESKGQKSE